MLKSNISLVKKHDSWVPRKEQQVSIIEKHGYTLTKTLGEGAYAKVKLANSKKHNCQVAVKVINKRRAPKDFLKKFLPREVHLLHRLNHPNVIRLYEVVETTTKVFIILQLASKGDLLEYINSRPMLSEDEVRRLFCQLAAAMAYCHKEQVVHRDLKCENILIGGDDKLKVTDFGFAISTVKGRLLETFCGSFAYCCPEILRGQPYDGKKADVWSMGVVLYAMGCARLPFSEEDMKALAKKTFADKIKFSKRVSKEYRDLVRWMLHVNPADRASAEQAFRSPWCMQAIKDNPELSYLVETPNPVLVRKPSECAPQEEDEFEEETYPADVKQVHAKTGEKSNRDMITCFTFAAPTYVTKQTNQSRRHTISGYEIHDKSYRANLRDDLLRSLAQKEMRSRSMQKTEEEKKAPPDESFNRQKSRRRSSLVTDVITTTSPCKHKPRYQANVNTSLTRNANSGGSLVRYQVSINTSSPSITNSGGALVRYQANMNTSSPSNTNSSGSLVRYQANVNTAVPSKLEIVKARKTGDNPADVPSRREMRMKEIAKLRHTSAARAAKMAFQEANISMKANRRLSILWPAHYSTIPGVEMLPEFSRSRNVDKNTSVKFKNWQKKFKIGLAANSAV